VTEITDLVRNYFYERGLVWPKTVWEALGWAHTELGEVYELVLSRRKGWLRNNPENHSEFTAARLAEELGDTIMMLVVAGIVEGVDPVEALREKIIRILYAEDEDGEPN